MVVDDDEQGTREPIGMLTDRDMVVGVLAHTNRHLHALTVGDVITPKVVTAWESEAIEDVVKRGRSLFVGSCAAVGPSLHRESKAGGGPGRGGAVSGRPLAAAASERKLRGRVFRRR